MTSFDNSSTPNQTLNPKFFTRIFEMHDRARVHTTVYLLSRGDAELHEAHVRELRESCDAFRDLTEVGLRI